MRFFSEANFSFAININIKVKIEVIIPSKPATMQIKTSKIQSSQVMPVMCSGTLVFLSSSSFFTFGFKKVCLSINGKEYKPFSLANFVPVICFSECNRLATFLFIFRVSNNDKVEIL